MTALMMEAGSISEISVNLYLTARCNDPEDSHLRELNRLHSRRNGKSVFGIIRWDHRKHTVFERECIGMSHFFVKPHQILFRSLHDLVMGILPDVSVEWSIRNLSGQPVGNWLQTATLLVIVRFQVLTAASMKMTVFWDVAPCSLVEIYRRFRGAYCLYRFVLMMEAASMFETSSANHSARRLACYWQY
jgi:hypothetical protein